MIFRKCGSHGTILPDDLGIVITDSTLLVGTGPLELCFTEDSYSALLLKKLHQIKILDRSLRTVGIRRAHMVQSESHVLFQPINLPELVIALETTDSYFAGIFYGPAPKVVGIEYPKPSEVIS